MNRVVFLGASAACVPIIEHVHGLDPAVEFFLIGFDGHYPYHRDAFTRFIRGAISPSSVFCRGKDFFQTHNVRMILDDKITRINFSRKRLFTENKDQIDFDAAIITDTPENRFPSIKGTNKTGVYGFKKLKDIEALVNNLHLIETIAVRSDSLFGLDVALSFADRGKEVMLIASEQGVFSQPFPVEIMTLLKDRIHSRGVRVFSSESIQEVLGDKDVKAVRLRSGKVLSAQAAVFVETDADFRFLADSGIQFGKTITVNGACETAIKNIYAVDWVSGVYNSGAMVPGAVLTEEAKAVAASICGQVYPLSCPVAETAVRLSDFNLTCLGETLIHPETIVHQVWDQPRSLFRAIICDQQQRVTGAVLVHPDHDDALGNIRQAICDQANADVCLDFIRAASRPLSLESAEKEAGKVSVEVVDN